MRHRDAHPACVIEAEKTAAPGPAPTFWPGATDGANPTNFTNNAVVDFDPEWQPVP